MHMHIHIIRSRSEEMKTNNVVITVSNFIFSGQVYSAWKTLQGRRFGKAPHIDVSIRSGRVVEISQEEYNRVRNLWLRRRFGGE